MPRGELRAVVAAYDRCVLPVAVAVGDGHTQRVGDQWGGLVVVDGPARDAAGVLPRGQLATFDTGPARLRATINEVLGFPSVNVRLGHPSSAATAAPDRPDRTRPTTRRRNSASFACLNIDQRNRCVEVERVTRIELALSAWEADVLPLNYTRGSRLGIVPGDGSRIRWLAADVDRPRAMGRSCDHFWNSWVSAGAGDGELRLQQLS
jgi:hypothetical protein